MPYLYDHNGSWSCVLETERCSHVAPGGKRCGRNVTVGLDLCWQHCRRVYGVKIAPSPLAGNGIFAVRQFEKGEWMCPYGGKVMGKRELDLLYPGTDLAPYTERINSGPLRNKYTDAACVRGIGSMANGMRRKADSNVMGEYRPSDGKVWLRVITRIEVGEEILNYYGKEYFSQTVDPRNNTKYVSPQKLRKSKKSPN